MYANELLIGTRVKLSEDVDVYYDIEGIHAPVLLKQNGSDKRVSFRDTIKKLLPANHAA